MQACFLKDDIQAAFQYKPQISLWVSSLNVFSDVICAAKNSAGLIIEKHVWSEYIGAKQLLQASVQDPPCPGAASIRDTPWHKDVTRKRDRDEQAKKIWSIWGKFFIDILKINCSASVVKKAVTCWELNWNNKLTSVTTSMARDTC